MAPVRVKSPTRGLVRPWRQIVPAELASDAIVRRYSDTCLVLLYVRDVAQLLRVVTCVMLSRVWIEKFLILDQAPSERVHTR